MKIYTVSLGNRLILETLFQEEALDCATRYFNDVQKNPERILPDVFEHEREPVDWRSCGGMERRSHG